MYCKKCGKALRPTDRFCQGCGTPIPVQSTNLNGQPYGGSQRQSGSKWHSGKGMGEPTENRGIFMGVLIGLGVVLIAVLIVLIVVLIKDPKSSGEAGVSDQQMEEMVDAEERTKDSMASESAEEVSEESMEEAEDSQQTQDSVSMGRLTGEKSTGFLFADSDSRYLDRSELENLSKEELSYARNEIYARRGRMFNSEELQAYFDSQDWYVPLYSPEDFDSLGGDNVLNEYELANKNLIVEVEKEKGYR